jgi:hypothetical protein
MSSHMKPTLTDIMLDSSTSPPEVEVNGTRMRFDAADDARYVFDLLNRLRDQLALIEKLKEALHQPLMDISRLVERL